MKIILKSVFYTIVVFMLVANIIFCAQQLNRVYDFMYMYNNINLDVKGVPADEFSRSL